MGTTLSFLTKKIPDVSVIMPVYNSADYVKNAIDSILQQTFSNFEFIIIDDASTDNTMSILKSYDDIRIFIIKNSMNLGVATSLNRAIERARGKYIIRMDSDDVAMKKRLEVQWMFMKKNPHVDICGSWVQTFGEFSSVLKYPLKHEEIKVSLLFRNPLAHPSVCFRREVFSIKKMRYDPNYSKTEDYELWIRVIQDCLIENIPQVLLYYRIHKVQVSKVYAQQQQRQSDDIRIRFLNSISHNFDQKTINAYLNFSNKKLTNMRAIYKMVKILFQECQKSQCVKQQSLIEVLVWRISSLKLDDSEIKALLLLVKLLEFSNTFPVVIYGRGSVANKLHKIVKKNYNLIGITESNIKKYNSIDDLSVDVLDQNKEYIFLNTIRHDISRKKVTQLLSNKFDLSHVISFT